jgi:hypothetical protein
MVDKAGEKKEGATATDDKAAPEPVIPEIVQPLPK